MALSTKFTQFTDKLCSELQDENFKIFGGYHGTRPGNLDGISTNGLLKVGNPKNPSKAVDKGYFALSPILHLAMSSIRELIHSLVLFITFGDKFDQLVNQLPRSLAYLEFGHYFNQRVDFLPPSLISLKFGYTFNQPVDLLPSTLTQLEFRTKDAFWQCTFLFFQPLDKLPPSITHITLPTRYAKLQLPFAPSVVVIFI